MSFTLFELAEATGGRLLGAEADIRLDRLVIDSREATTGALFVALMGETTDGHRFLGAAVEAGAGAVLCQTAPADLSVPRVVVDDTREALVRFTSHQLQRRHARVVGVTGSVGKTTTKELVAAVLGQRFDVLKTEGNLNTYTGLPMSVARMEPHHQVFVAEYAMSAPGEIAFLARMAPPDVAIVLNVGLAHVGLLGTIDAVAAAKRELVDALGPGGTAILNADDLRVTAMAAASPAPVVTFGFGDADVGVENLELGGLDGSSFAVRLPGGDRAQVKLRTPGAHSVSNALAAAAAGHVMGLSAEQIAAGLSGAVPVAGRGTLRPGRRGSVVIDDAYNASPSSMEAALQVLLAETSRTRVAVLGDMLELGDEASSAHFQVGQAASGVDFLVVLGEHAADLVEGARAAGLADSRIAVVASPDDAAAEVEGRLENALVLVKASRGMALERVVERLVQSS